MDMSCYFSMGNHDTFLGGEEGIETLQHTIEAEESVFQAV